VYSYFSLHACFKLLEGRAKRILALEKFENNYASYMIDTDDEEASAESSGRSKSPSELMDDEHMPRGVLLRHWLLRLQGEVQPKVRTHSARFRVLMLPRDLLRLRCVNVGCYWMLWCTLCIARWGLLHVARGMLYDAFCMFLQCMLRAARCMLHAARCMLHAARGMLHAARGMLHAARGMLYVVRFSVGATERSLVRDSVSVSTAPH
jgi:hypothetical protein